MRKKFVVKQSNIEYICNAIRSVTNKHFMFRKEMTCQTSQNGSEHISSNEVNTFKNPFGKKSCFICAEFLQREDSVCIRVSSSSELGSSFIIIRPGDEITFKRTGIEIWTTSMFQDKYGKPFSELTVNNLYINPFRRVKNLEELEGSRYHELSKINLRFRTDEMERTLPVNNTVDEIDDDFQFINVNE